jgi:methylthioribose-1-phosphate isomerase
MPVQTIRWKDGRIRIIDQTRLPNALVYLDMDSIDDLCEAIQTLRIRGAPAIGIAGSMGAALAAHQFQGESRPDFDDAVRQAVTRLRATRPTAVNLFWALDRMEQVLSANPEESVPKIREKLIHEALKILEEDDAICRRIGENGLSLIPDSSTILTHCNTGGLATSGYGTALGVVYAAFEAGKKVRAYVDETRPLLQGARLTAWELREAGIEVTVLCDSAAATLMQQGMIDCVIVGADRIAANGDTANKIGTYALAVLAKAHDIPFYVAAPLSTFDLSIPSGDQIPIEQRDESEVSTGFGVRTVPEGVAIYNPAFDVTPHGLISAIVTEKGIITPPLKLGIRKVIPST